MADHFSSWKLRFSDATQSTEEVGEIEKTCGRAILIDGDVFYSPNSTRMIPNRPVNFPSPSRDIVTLQDPVWWFSKYAHPRFYTYL